ncbi:MAG: chaperone NapD [Nitrospirae bacterium]|nr:chaperone NapD [Nitrospirota bacterium]
MNVSGLVVRAVPEHLDDVMEALKTDGLCDIHFYDLTGKIIVTVEGGAAGEEVEKMRKIMDLPHVVSAELAYSCNENGPDQAMEISCGGTGPVPEGLNQ